MKRATRLVLGKTNPAWVVPLAAVTLLLCSNQPLRAQTASEDQTVEQLHRALEQRDALIQNLLHRVEQLEHRVGVSPATAQTAPALPALAEPAPPAQQAQTEPAPTEAKPAEPGAFEVDEEAAERALERTLTATGDLLLPAWSIELQSSFSYTRNVRDSSVRIFPLTSSGRPVPVLTPNAEVRRNEFNFFLGMQVGLPFDSQFELGIPYQIMDREVIEPQGSVGFDKTSDTSSSIGDLRIGIAKTFLRERGWWPDLIGRMTWDTDTGKENDGDVALGGGFNELRLSLTTLKRLDPLAFTVGFSYEKTFEENDIEPGDEYGVSLGVNLATSPETALSATLRQVFFDEDKFNGRKDTGSDGVSSSIILGASTIVGRGILLSLTPAIGLTDDAPDYSVNLFGTIRLR